MTQLHIEYEVEEKKNEIAEYEKMNKQMDWPNFIFYMKLKGKKKEIAECKNTNKQMDWLNFIFYMKLKERKWNSWIRKNE